jgi:Aspartyl protease
MVQLTFPIVSAGLVADVLVNLEAPLLLPLRSSGGGPAPIPAKALVDTGSDITAVALPILQQLMIPPIRQATTHSLGGPIPVNLYRVSLHIFDSQNVASQWLSEPSLVVMELVPGFPFDVLLGMDILLTCMMLLDGPARQFSLDF